MNKIDKAKEHLYHALEGILSGGCKHATSVHIQEALQYLYEYQEEQGTVGTTDQDPEEKR